MLQNPVIFVIKSFRKDIVSSVHVLLARIFRETKTSSHISVLVEELNIPQFEMVMIVLVLILVEVD